MRVCGVRVGLASVLAVWGGLAAAAPPPFDPKAFATAVDADAEAARAAFAVPGVAVVVVKGGEVVHLKGYGSRRLGTGGAKDEPVTPDTLFPLASCTKAFTSAAVAALVDDGKMGWDDPVRKHLPTFHLSDEAADKLVSVRDLLSHRSGVGPHDLLWYRAPWNLDETVRRIPLLPLSAPFRGGYQYSSVTVLAAGKAAENRYADGWEKLVADKITTPLGMKGVAFTTKQAKGFDDRASGYTAGKGGKPEPADEYDMTEPNPAGSMFCTPREFGRWIQFHLSGGKVGKEQVVSAKELGETHQPHTPIRLDAATRRQHPGVTQMDYAMGWVVYSYRGELVVAHGGLIDGFRVLTVLLPEHNAGFAVFANRERTKLNLALGNTLTDRLVGLPTKEWDKTFQALDEQEAADKKAEREERAKARKADRPPTLAAEKVAGEYTSPAYGTGVLALGDKPEWRFSTFKVPLEHWQDDTYRATGGRFEDEFLELEEVKGQVVARFRGIEFGRK